MTNAQLFKCVQNGKTVYQQEKCPEAAAQSTLRGPDPVPEKPLTAKAAEEKAAQAKSAEIDGIIDVMVGFNLCSQQVEGFGQRYGPAFEDWRTRNAAGFARFNADAEAPAKLNARLGAERSKGASDDAEGRAARSAMCARMISTIQPGRGTK